MSRYLDAARQMQTALQAARRYIDPKTRCQFDWTNGDIAALVAQIDAALGTLQLGATTDTPTKGKE